LLGKLVLDLRGAPECDEDQVKVKMYFNSAEKDLLGIPSSNASIQEFEEMFVESKHTHEVMLWLNR